MAIYISPSCLCFRIKSFALSANLIILNSVRSLDMMNIIGIKSWWPIGRTSKLRVYAIA